MKTFEETKMRTCYRFNKIQAPISTITDEEQNVISTHCYLAGSKKCDGRYFNGNRDERCPWLKWDKE